jgi:hypothetical protein
MSSVIIAGDTSGSITVAAPAAAGTNTITMPAATGTMALTSDITTEIPSQTGNAGKLLTTNGSAASWGGVSDYTTFTNLTEKVTVAATAATGTINYDTGTQSVVYYTSNAAGDWTINFRDSSGATLNSKIATGEAITLVHLVTLTGAEYRNTVVQVDGSSITPEWQGGAAPTEGNINSIDSYAYTIIKTGDAAFTILAALTQFA